MKKAQITHKDSTSDTLNEVLSSLEDVLTNELSDVGTDTAGKKQDDRDVVISSLKTLISETRKRADKLTDDMPARNDAAHKEARGTHTRTTASRSRPAKKKDTRHTPLPGQLEIGWDDIPVLDEIVVPSPLAGFSGNISREVRTIAIKVVAALNIDLRKDGKQVMDMDTIMRLQSLLARELAAHLPQSNDVADD